MTEPPAADEAQLLDPPAASPGPDRLPRVMRLVREGMEAGRHVGFQGFVSLWARPVAEIAIGLARPGIAMQPDTVMLWLSACKPVTAVAVAQLWERGRLDLDDRVAVHIPEFGRSGKDAVTIRHLLTHTAGFRGVAGLWSPLPWDSLIKRVCDARLEPGWVPGQKAGYHVASAWYVLGELVRRLDGRTLDHYVREEIFLPLGMEDSWIGMPPDRYRRYGDRIGVLYETETGPPKPGAMDTEDRAALVRPGGNGRGPIRELGIFYEALLLRGSRAGASILSPQAVEAFTARHRTGMFDETFKHIMDWGLGFMVASNQYGWETIPYGFGHHCSPRTFGHAGHQSSIGFADPECGLAAALVANGMPGERAHNDRFRAIITALYEDLGLARYNSDTA